MSISNKAKLAGDCDFQRAKSHGGHRRGLKMSGAGVNPPENIPATVSEMSFCVRPCDNLWHAVPNHRRT
jgi:hypothetical protein